MGKGWGAALALLLLPGLLLPAWALTEIGRAHV